MNKGTPDLLNFPVVRVRKCVAILLSPSISVRIQIPESKRRSHFHPEMQNVPRINYRGQVFLPDR